MSKTTQISFKTDARLKERALEKAKQEGITLKALLSLAMKAYLRDQLTLDLRPKEEPSEFFKQALQEATEDLKRGDVISFKDPEAAINYLNRFTRRS